MLVCLVLGGYLFKGLFRWAFGNHECINESWGLAKDLLYGWNLYIPLNSYDCCIWGQVLWVFLPGSFVLLLGSKLVGVAGMWVWF